MATQVQLLRELLGAGQTVTDAALEDYLATAVELVAAYTQDVPDDEPVPSAVLARAQRAVAAELHNQDQAPNGFLNQEFNDGAESVPVRIGTDPLRPARALLGLWVDPVTIG